MAEIKTPVSVVQVVEGDRAINYYIADASGRNLRYSEIAAALNEREELRKALKAARAPIYAQARYGDVADSAAWSELVLLIDAALGERT